MAHDQPAAARLVFQGSPREPGVHLSQGVACWIPRVVQTVQRLARLSR